MNQKCIFWSKKLSKITKILKFCKIYPFFELQIAIFDIFAFIRQESKKSSFSIDPHIQISILSLSGLYIIDRIWPAPGRPQIYLFCWCSNMSLYIDPEGILSYGDVFSGLSAFTRAVGRLIWRSRTDSKTFSRFEVFMQNP